MVPNNVIIYLSSFGWSQNSKTKGCLSISVGNRADTQKQAIQLQDKMSQHSMLDNIMTKQPLSFNHFTLEILKITLSFSLSLTSSL